MSNLSTKTVLQCGSVTDVGLNRVVAVTTRITSRNYSQNFVNYSDETHSRRTPCMYIRLLTLTLRNRELSRINLIRKKKKKKTVEREIIARSANNENTFSPFFSRFVKKYKISSSALR